MPGFGNSAGVSLFVTCVGTAVSLVLTLLAAYGLSRPGSLGHRPLLLYFLLTFPSYPGLVPSYLVVSGLGLKNSLWSLILPGAVSVFNLVVVRAFIIGIPGELFDAARVDGVSEFHEGHPRGGGQGLGAARAGSWQGRGSDGRYALTCSAR